MIACQVYVGLFYLCDACALRKVVPGDRVTKERLYLC